MVDNVLRAVRDASLWLPETEEFISHGAPNFRVSGKTFATYVLNHHGDGRVALWLNSGWDSQQAWVNTDPKRFFVPPYVGTRGWLGVDLNAGPSWRTVAELIREAYARVAPKRLALTLSQTKTPHRRAPPRLKAGEIDGLRTARGTALLKVLRAVCLDLPEVREHLQFGHPVWQAGRKTFAWLMADSGRFSACFWVGVDQQSLLVADERFRIPAYLGHNGWIAVDVTRSCDAGELGALALQSYRHFALKRMLGTLGAE